MMLVTAPAITKMPVAAGPRSRGTTRVQTMVKVHVTTCPLARAEMFLVRLGVGRCPDREASVGTICSSAAEMAVNADRPLAQGAAPTGQKIHEIDGSALAAIRSLDSLAWGIPDGDGVDRGHEERDRGRFDTSAEIGIRWVSSGS